MTPDHTVGREGTTTTLICRDDLSRRISPASADRVGKIGAFEIATMGSRDSGGVTVNCFYSGWTEIALIEPQIWRAQPTADIGATAFPQSPACL